MRKIRTGTLVVAAGLLAVPAAASAQGGPDQALCEPYLGLHAAFNSDAPDPAAIETMIGDAEAAAPADLADPLGTILDAARSVLDSGGEDFSPFETLEFTDAQSTVDRWAFDTCSFDASYEVAASEYAFGGMPDEIAAGNVAILVQNIGTEAHEMVVFRKHDGVTESWDELLALPEEEAGAKADFVGAVSVPAPESQALFAGTLEPGEYALVCFIAEGTTVSADGMTEGTGMPHFAHGMVQPFTVTA